MHLRPFMCICSLKEQKDLLPAGSLSFFGPLTKKMANGVKMSLTAVKHPLRATWVTPWGIVFKRKLFWEKLLATWRVIRSLKKWLETVGANFGGCIFLEESETWSRFMLIHECDGWNQVSFSNSVNALYQCCLKCFTERCCGC